MKINFNQNLHRKTTCNEGLSSSLQSLYASKESAEVTANSFLFGCSLKTSSYMTIEYNCVPGLLNKLIHEPFP